MHLRHKNLTMAIIPWPGAGWLCRAIWRSSLEILLDSRAWQLVRVNVPLQSKIFSTFFSVWKDSFFILMPRDAFTHIYTIKCWMWCCIPNRNLGFLPFLARGQPCRFTALSQEHTKRSCCFCLYIKHHWKSHHRKQKKSSGSSSLNPPDAVASLLSGEKMNLCP